MASQSVIAKLPRPGLLDPPNGPGAFQNLTDALDLVVIPRFNSSAARNAAIPAPSGGQHAWLTDSNTLTVFSVAIGDWVTYAAKTGTAWIQAEDATSITGITSVTAIPGTPVVGVSFVAPQSGAVDITVGGSIQSDSNATSILLGYEVRSGNVVGTGSVILSAGFTRAIRSSAAVISGAPAFEGGCHSRVLSGLAPGASYNVRTMHWLSSAGSGSVGARQITVKSVY